MKAFRARVENLEAAVVIAPSAARPACTLADIGPRLDAIWAKAQAYAKLTKAERDAIRAKRTPAEAHAAQHWDAIEDRLDRLHGRYREDAVCQDNLSQGALATTTCRLAGDRL